MRERERGRRKGQEGDGARLAGLWQRLGVLPGVYPQGGGSPGGLWVEGRNLTLVLTRALWRLLRGEQTGGGRGQGVAIFLVQAGHHGA